MERQKDKKRTKRVKGQGKLKRVKTKIDIKIKRVKMKRVKTKRVQPKRQLGSREKMKRQKYKNMKRVKSKWAKPLKSQRRGDGP